MYCGWKSTVRLDYRVDLLLVRSRRMTAQQAEHDRHEKQRGERGDHQAANDRAAERRVLLAAFPEAQRHRQHADDHGQRRHQHRPQAAHARFPGGMQRVESRDGDCFAQT